MSKRLLTGVTVGAAAVAILTVFVLVGRRDAAPTLAAPPELLVAAAPGRVEPVSGEIRIGSAIMGKIAVLLVHEGDRVSKNALLAQLEDEDYQARRRSAAADVSFRRSEHEASLGGGGPEERAAAAASLAAAERKAASAHAKLATASTSDAPNAAEIHAEIKARDDEVVQERRNLAMVQSLARSTNASRTAAALSVARAALVEAAAQLEKTRIRAPIAGVVLRCLHQAGETVGGTPEDVIFVLGDTSKLRVHAQFDERDVGHIAVGQAAYVTASAFGAQRFSGHITQIGLLVGRKTIGHDASVTTPEGNGLDVYIDLDDADKLIAGMRVDAFVKLSQNARMDRVP